MKSPRPIGTFCAALALALDPERAQMCTVALVVGICSGQFQDGVIQLGPALQAGQHVCTKNMRETHHCGLGAVSQGQLLVHVLHKVLLVGVGCRDNLLHAEDRVAHLCGQSCAIISMGV